MHMTPQEIKETAQKLFRDKKYVDAIPLLKVASEAFPGDESIWTELVLAAHHSGQAEQACKFAKDAVQHHPKSGWLWRQLGSELTNINHFDDAEKALKHARLLDCCDEWLWRYTSRLYRKKKDIEKEIEALECLCDLEGATGEDFNLLGIAYHNHKDFAKALQYYRRSYEIETSVCPLYNMGLVFNDPEVSRDLDAADVYRQALTIKSDYEPAVDKLNATKQKLIPLSQRATEVAIGLIKFDERYRFYVNPFELFQISPDCSLEDLGTKELQRARKLLLQEIGINDGKVNWLEDYPFDKARIISITDELDDEKKKLYHWKIFQNKYLLDFLSRGDIRHFLYSDEFFPIDILKFLDNEPGFRAFLSKSFSHQYNLVLTQAIERQLLPVIEVLFDGRRWVQPEDEDICFKGTLKHVHSLIEQMESMATQSTETKITAAKIDDFLSRQLIPEIFNLLPTAFRGEQSRIVTAMRQIAIACNNEHDDSEESAAILKLCKKFQFKSVDLNKRLEDDAKTVEAILKEKKTRQLYSNLTPIDAAPSLSTVNGIGFALYGAADYDLMTKSYIATYFFGSHPIKLVKSE